MVSAEREDGPLRLRPRARTRTGPSADQRRATDEAIDRDPAAPWEQRTIALIADRAGTDRVCSDWEAEGWLVMTIDVAEPTVTGHPVHVVRVAVPPPGWRSRDTLLAELSGST